MDPVRTGTGNSLGATPEIRGRTCMIYRPHKLSWEIDPIGPKHVGHWKAIPKAKELGLHPAECIIRDVDSFGNGLTYARIYLPPGKWALGGIDFLRIVVYRKAWRVETRDLVARLACARTRAHLVRNE